MNRSDPEELFPEGRCFICFKEMGQGVANVRSKGLKTLIECSEKRGDDILQKFLRSRLDEPGVVKIRVHEVCRNEYTLARNVARAKKHKSDDQGQSSPVPKKLRSSLESFLWTEECFICGQMAQNNIRHPDRNPVFEVRTIEIRETILEACDRDDNWSRDVYTRVQGCACLVAAEARYHHKCYILLSKGRRSENTSMEPLTGRPVNQKMHGWFLRLCEWLENSSEVELYTVADLMAKMDEIAGGEETYTSRTLKEKLIQHYNDHVFFAKIGGGQKDVLCFRNMANYIVHRKWHDEKIENREAEIRRIIVTCARLVKEEIREREYNRDYYPSLNDIRDVEKGREFLTPCLNLLMEHLISNSLRRDCVGQMITQAARPKTVISPLMFGLGLEMDHVFGSRFLIDELHALGMSISYDEVRLFKQSVLMDEHLGTVLPPESPAFTQWSADNADSTVETLVGDGQFHAIGMIAMSTGRRSSGFDNRIKRQARVVVSKLLAGKSISALKYFNHSPPALSTIPFKPLTETIRPYVIPSASYYSNILWQCARRLSDTPSPNWNGYMQRLCASTNDIVSEWDVMILPILNLSPSDDSGIYSALVYIQNQGEKLGLQNFCITFDQPLYLRASEIVEAKKMNRIVLRLGGFHLLMSALGSLYHLMAGSGIEEMLEQVYGKNVVKHIISGKAYDRAMRATLLVESALMSRLLTYLLEKETQIDHVNLSLDEIQELRQLFKRTLENPTSDSVLDEISDSAILAKVDRCLRIVKQTLSDKSRTARLWLQHLDYFACIKDFVRAERLSDWEGHLNAVGKLLNLFASTNHSHYAKSARLYLQKMRSLSSTHPWLYHKFAIEGMHAVRQSPRTWAGLSTDLVIEQTMMRSLKTRSGLTHGRGLTDTVIAQWIHSMHMLASVHDAMTTLTSPKYVTSCQHVEIGESRCKRDADDYKKFEVWLDIHDPFHIGTGVLRSIASGITANDDDEINCDQAEKVGNEIQSKLDGVPITAAKIKISDTVRTLKNLQPGLKVGNETIHIDPQVLFLRCTVLAEREQSDVASFFSYEMTTVPVSLFKEDLMRKNTKSDLAHHLEKSISNVYESKTGLITVLDGGWLLYQVKWTAGIKYGDLADMYNRFIERRFGRVIFVFDGYESSPKDQEHYRRGGKMAHWSPGMAEVYFQKEKSGQSYKLLELNAHFDPIVQKYILFIHAWSGCDTTSAVFGQGKLQVLRNLVKSPEMHKNADVISSEQSSVDEVSQAGIQIFVSLFGGKPEENFTALRYRKYQSMITTCKKIEPERLPPTERAAHFHTLRVHLQVVRWRTLNNDTLDANDWGWRIVRGRYIPIMTDKEAAHPKILKFIRYSCKPGSAQCATNACTCRKTGLKCVASCSGCVGQQCCNTEVLNDVSDDEN